MSVLGLMVFVTLFLVACGLLALAYSAKQGDHEHFDRLSLFPIEEERTRPADGSGTSSHDDSRS